MRIDGENFISAPDYFFLRDSLISYEGYVEGMGYVSEDTVIVPPAYFSYENPPRLIHPNYSSFIMMNVARLDNREETVARSYHLTPNEISQQILKDGYVDFPGGQRVFLPKNCTLSVDISTNDEQGQTVDTLHIKVQDKDTGNSYESTQTMANFLKGLHIFNDVMGFATEGIEVSEIPTTFRILRNKNTILSPKFYKSGWGGGSVGEIKTFKVLKVAKNIGRGLFFINIFIDGTLFILGEQSFTKSAMNIGVGYACCFILAPEVGLIVGISYFVLDQMEVINPIANYIEEILTARPVQIYRPDPSLIPMDKTRVVIEHQPLPIILNAN